MPCDCQTGPGNWASYGFSGEGLRPEFDPCGASPALPEPDAETEADLVGYRPVADRTWTPICRG